MRVFYKDSPVDFPLAIGLAALPGTDGKLQWQAEKPLSLPRVPSPLPTECTARESCSGKPANVSWKPVQPAREVGWDQDERDRCRPCWLQTVPDEQQRERTGRGFVALCLALLPRPQWLGGGAVSTRNSSRALLASSRRTVSQESKK